MLATKYGHVNRPASAPAMTQTGNRGVRQYQATPLVPTQAGNQYLYIPVTIQSSLFDFLAEQYYVS